MNEGREKDLYAWEKSIEAGAVIGKSVITVLEHYL